MTPDMIGGLFRLGVFGFLPFGVSGGPIALLMRKIEEEQTYQRTLYNVLAIAACQFVDAHPERAEEVRQLLLAVRDYGYAKHWGFPSW